MDQQETSNFTDFASSEIENEVNIATKDILSITTAKLFDETQIDKIESTLIDELWMKVKVVGDEKLHSADRQKLRGEVTDFPFEDIRQITKEANDTIFDFNLLGVIDQDFPQIFKYGVDDFYDWHVDINPFAPSRKLCFIINLTDPESYDGGELEFLNTTADNNLMQAKGSIVIFPSFIPYRISKVTSGEKRIIIGHIHGDLFK